jgi:hypothetical protein
MCAEIMQNTSDSFISNHTTFCANSEEKQKKARKKELVVEVESTELGVLAPDVHV